MKVQNNSPKNLPILALTVLRVLIGWHFLFEGISKLASPGWSSAAYLMESKWLFSGFFHWIISNPTALAVTDFLNVWGLILIGLGLFVGLFTRWASISGIVLLLLYYAANPPFLESGLPAQGQPFFINLNLIEAGILFIFALTNKDYMMWGLDRLFKLMRQHKIQLFPPGENSELTMNTRRELIKNLASLPILGVAFFGMAKKSGWLSFEENALKKADATTSASRFYAKAQDIRELKGKVPTGKIKHVEMSRIMPGGNLIAGFAHARDLIYMSDMIKNYLNFLQLGDGVKPIEAIATLDIDITTTKPLVDALEEYNTQLTKLKTILNQKGE